MAKRDADMLKAVVMTAEVCGTELSALAAEAMARELAGYPPAAVLEALGRCRREVTGRLSLAAIVQRVDDGRPGPEEAWALCPKSEDATAVWTDEACQAFGVAARLLAEGDEVAARMSFRETYVELVRKARDEKRPVSWTATLGHDQIGREIALREAVALGRLPADHVERLLPPSSANVPLDPALVAVLSTPVADPSTTDAGLQSVREALAKARGGRR